VTHKIGDPAPLRLGHERDGTRFVERDKAGFAAVGSPHLVVRERMVGWRPLRGLVPRYRATGRDCLLVGRDPRRVRKKDPRR